MLHLWRRGVILGLAACAAGCNPVEMFIRSTDAKPPDQRPPDWENTRRLMRRPAPRKGDPAPDLTLRTRDGGRTITASRLWASRPLVLIFGSFT